MPTGNIQVPNIEAPESDLKQSVYMFVERRNKGSALITYQSVYIKPIHHWSFR